MKETNKSLLVERAAAWLLSRIRENAVPLAASLIAGFLAYTFSFTNKLLNHDEAYSLFMRALRWNPGGGDWAESI